MQFSLLQSGHLKLLMLSLMKHHPSQSGVLQWNEFLEVAWTSFNDFCWCFSKTAGDTNYKTDKRLSPNKMLHDKISIVTCLHLYLQILGYFEWRFATKLKKMNAKFKYSTNLVSCKLNVVWMNRNGIYEGSITLSSNKLVFSNCLLTGFFDEKLKWTLQNFPTQIYSLSTMTMTKFYREIDYHYLISKEIIFSIDANIIKWLEKQKCHFHSSFVFFFYNSFTKCFACNDLCRKLPLVCSGFYPFPYK